MSKELYVLSFREYGWDEGEQDSFEILGIFEDKIKAEEEGKAYEDFIKHGQCDVKEISALNVCKGSWTSIIDRSKVGH